MGWHSFGAITLPGLSQILQAFEALTQVISGAASVAKAALSLSALARLTPEQMALKATIAAAQKLLEDLLSSGTSGYMLQVPARKKTIFSAMLADAMARAHLTTLPTYDEDPSSVKLWSAAAARGTSVDVAAGARSADGGNLGFLRTVSESLSDAGDGMRPRVPSSWYTWGVCFMAGAEDPMAYVALANWLTAFTGGSQTASPFAASAGIASIPRPKSLTVKAVTPPSAAGTVTAWITWEGAASPVALEKLGNEVVTTRRVALLRSSSPRALLGKSCVKEVMGTESITAGMAVGDVKVVSISDYVLAKPCVLVDETAPTLSYYAIAYECEVRGSSLGFGSISNTARLLVKRNGTPRSLTSQPPDWYRVAALDLLPWVAPFVRDLSSWVSSLDTTVAVDALKSAQQAVLDGVVAAATETLSRLSRLQALVNLGLPTGAPFGTISFHVTSFESEGDASGTTSEGGAVGIVDGIAKALSDTTDPNRPPFDKGTELVAGFVLAYMAPTKAALAPVIATVSALLGVGSSTATAAVTTYDSLVAALDSVGDSLEAIEAEALAEDFKPGSVTMSVTSSAAVQIGTDDAGCPAAPTTPTLGDDFAEDA